nr:histone chaperone ASF1-like [Parasteatoda tepidariorum]
MDKSDLYRFALLNHWRKEREKYPRPNPYEDGSEFEDEFDLDDIELDEIDFDEEYMMELRAEVPSSDDDEVNDDEVGDDDDECDEVGDEVKNEDNNNNEGDGVEELIREELTYPTFLFSDVQIARLYKMDVVHDKDSIEFGIEDDRLKSRDGPFLRDEVDFWQRSDIELTINEPSEQKEKGCFHFFSRMFRRLFKRK